MTCLLSPCKPLIVSSTAEVKVVTVLSDSNSCCKSSHLHTRSKSKHAQWLRLCHPSEKLPMLAERLALVSVKCPAPMTGNNESPPSILYHFSSPEPPKTTYLDTDHHLLSLEYDHHKVNQLCYYCRHAGHFYQVCPHPKSAASLCKSGLNKLLTPQWKRTMPCLTSTTISSRWEMSKQSSCLSTLWGLL